MKKQLFLILLTMSLGVCANPMKQRVNIVGRTGCKGLMAMWRSKTNVEETIYRESYECFLNRKIHECIASKIELGKKKLVTSIDACICGVSLGLCVNWFYYYMTDKEWL